MPTFLPVSLSPGCLEMNITVSRPIDRNVSFCRIATRVPSRVAWTARSDAVVAQLGLDCMHLLPQRVAVVTVHEHLLRLHEVIRMLTVEGFRVWVPNRVAPAEAPTPALV